MHDLKILAFYSVVFLMFQNSLAGQMGEEFEHRIGTIESSLSRFGLMLESLQTDIMQVNKGTTKQPFNDIGIGLFNKLLRGV